MITIDLRTLSMGVFVFLPALAFWALVIWCGIASFRKRKK